MKTPKRYNPSGVETELPVTVRFMPEERQEIIAFAKEEGRSLSNFVRFIFLLGLAEWKRQRGLK